MFRSGLYGGQSSTSHSFCIPIKLHPKTSAIVGQLSHFWRFLRITSVFFCEKHEQFRHLWASLVFHQWTLQNTNIQLIFKSFFVTIFFRKAADVCLMLIFLAATLLKTPCFLNILLTVVLQIDSLVEKELYLTRNLSRVVLGSLRTSLTNFLLSFFR